MANGDQELRRELAKDATELAGVAENGEGRLLGYILVAVIDRGGNDVARMHAARSLDGVEELVATNALDTIHQALGGGQ